MERQPIVSIKGLKKAFGKNLILKGIDLDVYAGQIIGYIGPNGAGKSTTIKILIGMMTDFVGQVKILDFDIREDAIEVKKHIGYVPENAIMYEVLTPMEYLLFVGRLHKMTDDLIERRANELLEVFELQNHSDVRMNTFSKGMRQKVLLIAGLIHNPAVIFLDEPLSGLDANAVILVKEVLTKLKAAGKTIFYSSHIMDVVEKISDRIIILDQGTIIADGTIDELRTYAQSGTLEGIFQGLTGNNQTENRAESFLNAFR